MRVRALGARGNCGRANFSRRRSVEWWTVSVEGAGGVIEGAGVGVVLLRSLENIVVLFRKAGDSEVRA